MKKLFFIIPALIVLSFANCKKAKGPASVPSIKPDNSIDSQLTLSTLLNNREWQTDSAFSYKVKNSGNDSGIINLMIVATRKSTDTAVPNSSIVININNYTGPHTYIIDPPVNSLSYYVGTVRHYATLGKFVVLSDTGQILNGTFEFSADTIKGTAGAFKVALP